MFVRVPVDIQILFTEAAPHSVHALCLRTVVPELAGDIRMTGIGIFLFFGLAASAAGGEFPVVVPRVIRLFPGVGCKTLIGIRPAYALHKEIGDPSHALG